MIHQRCRPELPFLVLSSLMATVLGLDRRHRLVKAPFNLDQRDGTVWEPEQTDVGSAIVSGRSTRHSVRHGQIIASITPDHQSRFLSSFSAVS